MADGDDVQVSIDSTRERLFEEIRALAARADAVPDSVVHAAKGAFAWRTIDAELAELAFDSLVDHAALVRSGDPSTRLLSFEAPEATIELEVAKLGERRRVIGQVIPARPTTVEIRHAGGLVTVEGDALGRFQGEIDGGPMSLRCRVEVDGRPVVETDWVTV